MTPPELHIAYTLDCGCAVAMLGGRVNTRRVVPSFDCRYHGCRHCGWEPDAVSLPDRLCSACWKRWLQTTPRHEL